jgi:TolB protein
VGAEATAVKGKIAFVTDRDGNDEIYVMNADGSNPTNLTNNPAFDADPDWSPDGTKIAFSTHRDGNYEIYVMNADGSSPVNRTNNAATDVHPAWSPDGTKIAFTTDRDGVGVNDEVYVMNANGSAPTRVSNHPASELEPDWSPDGTKIVVRTDRGFPNQEIYIMNSDGSAPTNLTNNAAYDSLPSWQGPLEPIPSVSGAKAIEGKVATFTVSLPSPLAQSVTYTYKTKKGTAKPGKDFKGQSGALTFAPGTTAVKVQVKTIQDLQPEKKEDFFLSVSISSGTVQGKGKIKDDD